MTKRQVYLGKSGFFSLLGIIQALIVSIGDLVILEAPTELPILSVSIVVFNSLVFNPTIYISVSLLGNPGKVVAIILLVLQIAGGGGIFSTQTTPEFSQTIPPYLPFTYPTGTLREIVGGIVPEILTTRVIILGSFGTGLMVVSYCLRPVIGSIIRKITEKVDESKVTE